MNNNFVCLMTLITISKAFSWNRKKIIIYILRANKENEALLKIIGWSMIRDKKLLIDISIHMQVRLYKYISISTNKYLCPSKDTLALSLSM